MLGSKALRLLVIAIAALAGSYSFAQQRTLKPEDYKGWESLGPSEISADGRWLAYNVGVVDGDLKLTVKNNDTPALWTVPGGFNAGFSDDSKWCAYLMMPPRAVVEKLREEKKPVVPKLGIRDLGSGQEMVMDGVMRYHFVKGSHYLLVHRTPPEGKAHPGSDLLVLDLATGQSLTVGNVADAHWNLPGKLVALSIVSDSGENGVQLLDLGSSRLKTILWGKESIAAITWADKADVLGFLVGREDPTKQAPAFSVVLASDLTAAKPTLHRLDFAGRKDAPAGKRIDEFEALELSDDGNSAAFGVQDWLDKKPPSKPEDRPGVEIWNSHDKRVIPQQRVFAGLDRRRSLSYVWRSSDDSLQPVTTDVFQDYVILSGFQYAIVTDTNPYLGPVSTGIAYQDVYVVNLTNGARSKVLTHTQWDPVASPDGRYFAYYQGRDWWLYDISAAKSTNITRDLKVSFANEDDDHTIPEKPPVAMPVWLNHDAGLVLHDKYDAWLVRTPTLSTTCVTSGRKDRQIYRLQSDVDLLPGEDGPSLQRPLYFSIFDEREKGSGYYRLDPDGKGKILALDNISVSGLHKAAASDRVIFTMGSYETSPNLYVTNTQFSQVKPESKTNPQQSKFFWGHTELVHYKSRFGAELSGVLIYPANYVKGLTYPMVTYIYERLSQHLHDYVVPSDASPYNPQVLSQNGYFVYMPDITYRPRDPGLSAVDCLEPAISAVLAENVGVDSTKIGLMGHSWGAYETAFVTTVSKDFAVGVAGAPITELTSMYNSFYWNSGTPDQELFESVQGRMGVPFWDDPKPYFDNSPVWQSKKRTAPILIAFGTQDGAVDWHQGQYLFNTLRRMGKNCVMLVYPGENHSLAKRANQLDYAHRLRHFLDVYLKGVKPEPWVVEGVPFLKQEE